MAQRRERITRSIPCNVVNEIEKKIREFEETIWDYLDSYSHEGTECRHSERNILGRVRLGLDRIEPKVLEHAGFSRAEASALTNVSDTPQVPLPSASMAQRREGITIPCNVVNEIERKVSDFEDMIWEYLYDYFHEGSECRHSRKTIFDRVRLGLDIIEPKLLEHTGLSPADAIALTFRATPGRDNRDSGYNSATSAVIHSEDVQASHVEMEAVSPAHDDVGERLNSLEMFCTCVQIRSGGSSAAPTAAESEAICEVRAHSSDSSLTPDMGTATTFRRPSTSSNSYKRDSTNPNYLG